MATLLYTDDPSYVTLELGAHRIQLGGRDGDGFCYGHQSFDCLENLTPAEKAEADAAEYRAA